MKTLFLAGALPVLLLAGCGDSSGHSCTCRMPAPARIQHAYTPVSKALYDTIVHLDSLLFAAFNAHDAEQLKAYFSPELEFYHDKGGFSDYAKTNAGFVQLFAANATTGLRREPVGGTFEVYPIAGYGAVQTGEHRFIHTENGQLISGTCRFMHLWRNQDGRWQITRIISYDH